MALRIVDDGESLMVVALEGKLDAAQVEPLQARFNSDVTTRGKHVLIDMSGVTFIASVGIRMLVEGAKTLRASHARIGLLKPALLVEKSLRASGFTSVVGIFQDETAARATLLAP